MPHFLISKIPVQRDNDHWATTVLLVLEHQNQTVRHHHPTYKIPLRLLLEREIIDVLSVVRLKRRIPNKLEYKTVLYHKVLLRLKTVFFFFDFSADKYIALQDSVL
jgi:hypothetical protein